MPAPLSLPLATPSVRGRRVRNTLLLGCAMLVWCGTAQAQRDGCGAATTLGIACTDKMVGARPVERSNERAAPVMLAAIHTEGTKVMAVRTQALPPPLVLDAVRPESLPAADFEAQAPIAPAGDLSMMGVLVAALGVVGFVAHRRSGR